MDIAEPGVQAWQVGSAIAYLVVLAAVGFAIVHYARRGFGGRAAATGDSPIRAIGTTRLSPSVSVTLVAVEGRRVLVSTSPTGTSMIELSEIERPASE